MIALAGVAVDAEQLDAKVQERHHEPLIEFTNERSDSVAVNSHIGTEALDHDARRDAQFEEKARRGMWIFLVALAALQTYFVQEMLAALFLFTLAFAVFAVIALAFYLANRASQASLERVEPIARVAARAGRRTYGFIEDVSKKPFRRPHSEIAP
jgi:hypothetical protein